MTSNCNPARAYYIAKLFKCLVVSNLAINLILVAHAYIHADLMYHFTILTLFTLYPGLKVATW